MKKDTIIAIIVLAIVLILLAWIFPANGQSSPNFWLLSGSNLKPISNSWNIQGNAFDPGGNKYVTSTTGGIASTTPWTLQNFVVASGAGLSTINATSGTYYNASNPFGYITTSTNNFGGLTNASITATLPITWSAGSVIACPTCGDVNGTGTTNYFSYWTAAHTLSPTSSISFDGVSTTITGNINTTGKVNIPNYASSSIGSGELVYADASGTLHGFGNGLWDWTGNAQTNGIDLNYLAGINFFGGAPYSSGTWVSNDNLSQFGDGYLAIGPEVGSGFGVFNYNGLGSPTVFNYPPTSGTFALGTGTSSLATWNTSGVLTTYGGASACPAGNAVTTISATGATTCSAFLTSAPATTTLNGVQSATFNYNVVSGNSLATTSVATSGGNSTTTITLNATLASSTLGPANYFDATTTSPYNQFTISGNDFKVTIAKFSCDTTNGTTTYHLIRATSTLNATGQAVADITCGATENDITSFTTSTLDAGTYLRAIVSSTTATPPSLDTLWGHGTKS